MNEYLRKWNPMSLFDNSVPPIKTIQTMQDEYKRIILESEQINFELKEMWCNYFGN